MLAIGAPVVDIEGGTRDGAVSVADPVGDVGKYHYIQMVNAPGGSKFSVFDKSNGSVELGPVVTSSLAPLSSLCSSHANGDPIVLYDSLADRWVLSEFVTRTVGTPPTIGNRMCVYVSKDNSSDKTGWGSPTAWHFYEMETANWPDFPKLTVWPDGYHLSTSEGFEALLPSDFDGRLTPPTGTPNFVIRHNDDEATAGANTPQVDYLELYEFTVDWNAQPQPTSSLTLSQSVAIADFDSDLCGSSVALCLTSNGPSLLRATNWMVMWRLQYRNFGTHESLVGNFTVDVGNDRSGVRWFELRRQGGTWSVHQEGTQAPADGNNRAYGSVAMDGDGNIALGYGIAGSGISPDFRFTGRRSTDPQNQMTLGEHSSSVPSQGFSGNSRWNDYTAMVVDPVDDATFWYTAQYWPVGVVWGTRIVAFTITKDPVVSSGSGDEEILVRVRPNDPTRIDVSIDGITGNTYLASDLNSLTLDGGSGNDRMTVDGSVGTHPVDIVLRGGSGEDRFEINNGSNGASVTIVDNLIRNHLPGQNRSGIGDMDLDGDVDRNTLSFGASGGNAVVNFNYTYPNGSGQLSYPMVRHGPDPNLPLSVGAIDAMFADLQASIYRAQWDLNNDAVLDYDDTEAFIENVLGTFIGDADLDGQVNAIDLTFVGSHWQMMVESWGLGDFDGDGDVDANDLNALGVHWQQANGNQAP